MSSATLKSAVEKIDRHGCLLVFPIDNRKEPPSLWSAFYPRTSMRWEWDESGDRRVAGLWHLREELSRSKRVVYAKWYQGRATFFSRALFPALLKALNPGAGDLVRPTLESESERLLGHLRESSPQSTKELKASAGLRGRALESAYNRALKALWERLLIVGFGEVDDGAFPSLAIGASELLFEELFREAEALPEKRALVTIAKRLPPGSLFRKYFEKLRGRTPPPKRPRVSVIHHSDLSLRRS